MKPRAGTRALAIARSRLAVCRVPLVVPRVSVSARRLATAATAPRRDEIDVVPVVVPPSRPVAGSAGVASILHDTSKLLAHDVGGSTAWYERVETAARDLGSVRRARLAGMLLGKRALTVVTGTDVASPHDVVSAILQDPLADAESTRTALLERYFGTSQDTVVISYVIARVSC